MATKAKAKGRAGRHAQEEEVWQQPEVLLPEAQAGGREGSDAAADDAQAGPGVRRRSSDCRWKGLPKRGSQLLRAVRCSLEEDRVL